MPVPENYYEATCIWKVNTSIREMTIGFGLIDLSLDTPRSPSDVADSVFDVFTTGGHPGAANAMIDEYSFLGVNVALGTASGDLLGQHLETIVGTVSDSPVPSNCALLITKNTAAGGRRNRGRIFAPPTILNEGAVDASGNIASGPLAALQTEWDAVQSGLEANDLFMMLFHQGAFAPIPTAITSLTVQSQIATQRRRMRG